MNFFSLILSGQHFFCPSFLIDSFAGSSNLGCESLLLIILNTSCQSLIGYKVSFEKSAYSIMGTPFQVTLCFSLAAFKIISLSLSFGILIMMCLGVVLFDSIFLGLPVLPELVCLFPLPNQGSFLPLFFQISFQFLSVPLLLLAPL